MVVEQIVDLGSEIVFDVAPARIIGRDEGCVPKACELQNRGRGMFYQVRAR